MFQPNLTIWLILSGLIVVANAGNILIYFPCISKSITFPLTAQVTELVKQGHHVTFATAYVLKDMDGLTNIEVGAGLREWVDVISSQHLFSGKDLLETDLFERSMVAQDEAVTRILQLNKKFDTVMVYPAFGNEVGMYLAEKWGANLILYITDMPTTAAWLNYAFGPVPTYDLGSVMSVWKSLSEKLYGETASADEPFRDGEVGNEVMKVVQRHFPDDKELLSKSIEDIERKASLILSQGNPLLMNGMRPVTPNVVYVGMMQCRPAKKLPDDIQKFMDEATEGVVYVSFGSVLQGALVPKDKQEALLNAFGKLKQKVLWKWESKDMKEKPANVMTKDFLPQQDVLGHPNLKAFVTHAGYLSFEESLCHKVPIVATPICYDQFENADEIVNLGVGASLRFIDITEEKLSALLNQVLNNEKYSKTMQKLGSALAPWDEMVGPVERSVWWIEHIMKNPGVYSISQFYQKIHKPTSNINVDKIARIFGVVAIISLALRFLQLAKVKKD